VLKKVVITVVIKLSALYDRFPDCTWRMRISGYCRAHHVLAVAHVRGAHQFELFDTLA
jgi:hypothetical protein